jgi:hypothetical protein
MAETERNGTALEREYLPVGGKVRLMTLEDLDGRTLAVKKVRETQAAIWSDLGGVDLLSECQRQLARRAAVLGAILEHAEASWAAGRTFDLDKYLAATNTFRRIVETMRRQRRSRPANLIELMGEADG